MGGGGGKVQKKTWHVAKLGGNTNLVLFYGEEEEGEWAGEAHA